MSHDKEERQYRRLWIKPKNRKGYWRKIYRKEDKEFEDARNKVSQLHKNILWYRRRGLMPYDSGTYFYPLWYLTLDYFKVKYDGSLKKKDKRGHWR